MTFKRRFILAVLLGTALDAGAVTVSLAPGETAVLAGPWGSGRSAELTLISGSGALDFSNGTGMPDGVPTAAVGGLVGAINVAQIQLTPVDGATIQEQSVPIGRGSQRGVVRVGATVTSVQADDQTGIIQSVSSVGGAREVAPYVEAVLDGGTVITKNLRFDLQSKRAYADMVGIPLTFNAVTGLDEPGPTFTAENIELWTIGNIVGPTVIPPAALLAAVNGNSAALAALGYVIDGASVGYVRASAVNVLSDLKVTPQGLQFFASALGLVPGSTGYSALVAVNDQPDGWGSVTSRVTFSSSVPEPSSHVLMGLGLLGVWTAACRRRAAGTESTQTWARSPR